MILGNFAMARTSCGHQTTEIWKNLREKNVHSHWCSVQGSPLRVRNLPQLLQISQIRGEARLQVRLIKVFLGAMSIFVFSYLRQLFRNLFHRQGFTYDYVFDWNMLKFGGSRGPETETEQRYARKWRELSDTENVSRKKLKFPPHFKFSIIGYNNTTVAVEFQFW